MRNDLEAVIDRVRKAQDAHVWGTITLTLRDGRVTVVEVSTTHPVGRTEHEGSEDVHR